MQTNHHPTHKHWIVAAVIFLLASTACAQPDLHIPILKPQPTSTFTASPTPSPSSTPSPSPTATITPTITPTLAPMVLPKGPILIYTGKNTEMKIFWQADAAETFQVEIGADLTYSLANAAVNPANAENFLYSAIIGNLSPGTRYFYRLVQGQSYTGGSFVTAPDASATRLKFISYGDTRTNPQDHDTVAGQVVRLFAADPEYQTLNLVSGDLVRHGNEESDWHNEFFHPGMANIRVQLANLAFTPVRGNHEGAGELFGRYFPMPFAGRYYRAFDYGPAHFTLVDQYADLGPESEQFRWLVNDLATTNKPWKFVVLHEPGWSSTSTGRSSAFVKDTLQPLLEQYGVAILFAGHEHLYSRAVVNGVQHLTIGTGGAPIYDSVEGQPFIVASYQGIGFSKFEINENHLTGWFIDANDEVRDTFTITR